MAVKIPFPTSSAPGVRPQESAGRLINAYVEKTLPGAPSETIITRSPGLKHVLSVTTRIHTRGFLDTGSVLLWALNDRVFSVSSAFVATELGELAGTIPITMARNHAAVPDMVAVTENGCFNLFLAAAPTAFADADLPSTPTSVCDYHGYFIWSFGSGQIWASDLNSVAVNALSFNTEQGLFVRRVAAFNDRLYAFGDKWTAVYRDAGTTPFPLGREAVIPRGIIGTHAVAGWEPGWMNELIWAGDDFNVYRLNGLTPVPISSNDVSRAIEDAVYSGRRDLIEAFVYMHGRNAFWVLNCHDFWTWEFNLTTGEWNERKTHDRPCWRGMKSIRMFDKWIVGDEESGELHHINGEYFLDDLEPLVWHVESGTIHDFPQRVVIPRASFFITSAVGDFNGGYDPQVEISWSLDGGFSWGHPVLRKLGKAGESWRYPSIVTSGISKGQGIRYRLKVSDPVHVGLSGGVIDPQMRSV